jgi:HEAT repeats
MSQRSESTVTVNPLSRLLDHAPLAPVLQTIALAMAVILLSLIVQLALQKIVLERRYREEQDAADRYAKALADGTRLEDLAFDPRRPSQRRALARTLRASGADVATGQLRGAAWYGALVARLQRECRRKAWGERVAAFEMLEYLGTGELRPFLEEAARREDHPQAYAACLACLARLVDRPSGLESLWNQLQAKPLLSGSFNQGLFRSAIDALCRHSSRQSAAEAVQQLLAGANPLDPLTLDVIWGVAKAGLASLVPQLVALCGAAQAPKSLRIACVRAVGMLQPDHPLLLNALSDPDWEVQVNGAKLLRSTTPGVIAGLSGCLTSPAFYVRYNAATSLAALGRDGRTVLEAALTCSDAFARDISRYALRVLDSHNAGGVPDSLEAACVREGTYG